jgi:predicted DNA-binding transcriptional regulator AlpA
METPRHHLEELFRHLERGEIPVEEIPALLIRLAGVQTALAARLTIATGSRDGNEAPVQDRLLTAEQASALLATTPRWLYRHHKRLPFARQLSRKVLRFSEAGLRKWMNARKRT